MTLENNRFVTGYGMGDTHALEVNDKETGAKKPNLSRFAGKPYGTVSFDEIAKMAEAPIATEKPQAQWAIFSNYTRFDARSHDCQRANGGFWVLPVDLDKGAPDLTTLVTIIKAAVGDIEALIYSSRSATLETPKWRVLIPLAKSIEGSAYQATQRALFDLLDEGGLTCDRALERTGQLVYLPNRGDYYAHQRLTGGRLDPTDGPLADLVASNKRAEEQRLEDARRVLSEQPPRSLDFDDSDNPMTWYNANHRLTDVLFGFGYTQDGSSIHWRSPLQQSKSFATMVVGERWVSLSGSDINAKLGRVRDGQVTSGDAYDIYVHFAHGGDHTKAFKAIREMMPASPRQLQNDLSDFEVVPTGREEPVVDSKGRPQWCEQTAFAMILGSEDWADLLAYDEFVGVVMVCKPIPGTRTPKSSFRPRELADTDISHAVRWFNRNGFPRATKNVVADQLIACAKENIISPVRHYLEGLNFDGKPRVRTWLTAYAGAPDTYFNQAVGKAWLISAVARALNPGCKADCALILEGSQGVGKSSLLRVLAGSDWFHDGLGDLSNKDAALALRGKWIIELPELAAMRRTDVESTKAFLSRTTERYRPPYGRNPVVEDRRCVFAGTTNRQDWLADDTGGRRFWPVTVGDVRLDGLKQDRDQIWAEAVQLYKAGEKWWLEGDIELTASAIVGERGADDPWTATVLDYCRGKSEVSTKEILIVLGKDLSHQTRPDAMRVAGILNRNGWEKDGQFNRGDSKGLTRYVQRGAQVDFDV